MSTISRKAIAARRDCGYNGNCPRYLGVQDGRKILNATGVSCSDAFASEFTEVLENFGLELLRAMRNRTRRPTRASLRRCLGDLRMID